MLKRLIGIKYCTSKCTRPCHFLCSGTSHFGRYNLLVEKLEACLIARVPTCALAEQVAWGRLLYLYTYLLLGKFTDSRYPYPHLTA